MLWFLRTSFPMLLFMHARSHVRGCDSFEEIVEEAFLSEKGE